MTAAENQLTKPTARRRSTRGAVGAKTRAPKSSGGLFVLENAQGCVVRSFRWETEKIVVVYRMDNRRIETFATLDELDEQGIEYKLLALTTQSDLQKKDLEIAGGGRLRWIEEASEFSPSFELAEENHEEAKRIFGWSAGVQMALAGILIITGALIGHREKATEHTVTLIPQETIQKMLEAEKHPTPPRPTAEARDTRRSQPVVERRQNRKVVVAPSETKLRKNAPVPTRSTSFKKSARVAKKRGVRGGGYRSAGPRGYGTNERHMNQIGALGALDNVSRSRRGGNGGRGGLNLQAVGTEPGSGAGGKGYGGFGRNGGGGKGLGGLGKGKGMGLSNAMYGKGLVAAPFGDGSPAPGAGGYGTRGKAGGGAQGAGYGSETIVGSWKGTGPKGSGPAGSGAGNGDAYGSPFGEADADDDDVIVTGGLDRDQIAEVIQRNLGQITYCYEQGLQKKPSLSGRVAVRFQIGGRGRVDFAKVAHSSVRSAQVESCIAGKVKHWVFPKPQGGVSVAVTYPFVLRRVGQR